MKKPKVTILWSHLSGYFNACLKELYSEVAELILVHEPTTSAAPFYDNQFSWLGRRFNARSELKQAIQIIADQEPDILLVCGWFNRDYIQLAKLYKNKKTFVVGTCDNPWIGSIKQKAACLTSRLHVKSYFNSLWVPGQKSVTLAKKIGFLDSQIIQGLYTCDTQQFQKIFFDRYRQNCSLPHVFIYVGRYVESKGIKMLLEAYQNYRKASSSKPWELWLSGTGPLSRQISAISTVKDHGFTQPSDLPNLLSQAGTLILPSNYEHWGVVVHEATSAGLPVICTTSCGSAEELVLDGTNGYLVPPKDSATLAESMLKITHASQEVLDSFATQSHRLSLNYSPQKWVQSLLNSYYSYCENRHEIFNHYSFF